MLNRLHITLLLLFASIGLSVAAVTTENVLPTLSWQKSQLIYEITGKLTNKLNTIIPDKKFLLDIDVVVSEANKPDFSLNPPKPAKKVRFSNKKADQFAGDYVIFNKFGIEVPLVHEFDDAPTEKKSDYEYLWKYNEAMDLFRYIESIKVEVTFSDQIVEESRAGLEEIVKQTDLGLSGIKPKFAFKYSKLQAEYVVKKLEDGPAGKLLEWAAKFSNMIGLVMATLLLGIIAWLLFNKFEKMRAREKSAEGASISLQMPEGQESKDEKDEGKESLMSAEQGGEPVLSGVERFQHYFEYSRNEALLMIKQWIKSGDAKDKKVLLLLMLQLENEMLLEIFNELSLEERSSWKALINDDEAQVTNIEEASKLLSSLVVENIIVPPLVDDLEIADIVLRVSNENAAEFIKKEDEFAGTLVSIMNDSRLGKVLELLKPDEVRKAIQKGAAVDVTTIKSSIASFKERIKLYVDSLGSNIFLQKLVNMIPVVSYGSDMSMYECLAGMNMTKQIIEMAKKSYPSKLINELAADVISEIMKGLSIKAKAELLFVLDTQSRKTLLDKFAPEGGTARDILSFELEKYEINPQLKLEVVAKESEILSGYMVHARSVINKNYGRFDSIKETLEKWVNENKNGGKPKLTTAPELADSEKKAA